MANKQHFNKPKTALSYRLTFTTTAQTMQLFTLGHSAHPAEKFIHLLTIHGVQMVVDVRTAPVSRFHPQFNKASLAQQLAQPGLHYMFAGQALGGCPSDPACYKNRTLPGKGADYLREVDYPVVMQRGWFIQGIAQLLEVATARPTAIMCSEEDPARCHRHHLIAQYMRHQHPAWEVWHIRGNGVVLNATTLFGDTQPPAPQQTLF